MPVLTDADLDGLGLYRISPATPIWIANVVALPLLILAVGWLFHAWWLRSMVALMAFVVPALLLFLMSLTFALWTRAERRSHHADILYVRSYSKETPETAFLHGPSVLQLLVKGLPRPPYDIVSLFPPPAGRQQRYQDAMRTRGISHSFAFRTRDDEAWKNAIDHFIERCRLVIIECHRMAGGFEWEIHRMIERADPRRILLVADEPDRASADEIHAFLTNGFRKKHGTTDIAIPVLVNNPANPGRFSAALLETVRQLAPWTRQLMNERVRPVAWALALRILNQLFTVLFWISVVLAALTIGLVLAGVLR
jgi:hypothetical protein